MGKLQALQVEGIAAFPPFVLPKSSSTLDVESSGTEEGIELLRQLAEAVFSSGEIGKKKPRTQGRDRQELGGDYRGLKLFDQVILLLERVLDTFLREMADIN